MSEEDDRERIRAELTGLSDILDGVEVALNEALSEVRASRLRLSQTMQRYGMLPKQAAPAPSHSVLQPPQEAWESQQQSQRQPQQYPPAVDLNSGPVIFSLRSPTPRIVDVTFGNKKAQKIVFDVSVNGQDQTLFLSMNNPAVKEIEEGITAGYNTFRITKMKSPQPDGKVITRYTVETLERDVRRKNERRRDPFLRDLEAEGVLP